MLDGAVSRGLTSASRPLHEERAPTTAALTQSPPSAQAQVDDFVCSFLRDAMSSQGQCDETPKSAVAVPHQQPQTREESTADSDADSDASWTVVEETEA